MALYDTSRLRSLIVTWLNIICWRLINTQINMQNNLIETETNQRAGSPDLWLSYVSRKPSALGHTEATIGEKLGGSQMRSQQAS